MQLQDPIETLVSTVNKTTRKSGQSLIEVTIGIAVLVPVTLILVDLSVVLWGVQANVLTCRSAARSAASGDPEAATERAQVVIDRVDGRGPATMVSNSVLALPVEVNVVSKPMPQRDPSTEKEVNPGGPVNGSVTVTTEVEIRPFLLHSFFAKSKALTFMAKQTCPITYVMSPSPQLSNSESDNLENLSSDF